MQQIINLKQFIFFETTSKTVLAGLGFPLVIGSVFIQKFGNLAYMIAGWYKDYHFTSGGSDQANWFKKANRSFFYNEKKMDLVSYIEIYNTTSSSPEELLDVLKKYGLRSDSAKLPDEHEIQEYKQASLEQIEELFLKDIFFRHYFIEEIIQGKIKNLQPYKGLKFHDAVAKLENKKLFQTEKNLVKQYENGWKWINIGEKCDLVGKEMKNCGSAGVMSSDPDRTLLTLFSPENIPKVIVTYSPNQKRISSAEGQGSSVAKEKYHDFILDLEDLLDAKYDFVKDPKSTVLNMKSMFKPYLEKIEVVAEFSYYMFLKLVLKDGRSFYTNGTNAFPEKEVVKLFKSIRSKKKKDFNEFLRNDIFDFYANNQIEKINLYDLLEQLKQTNGS
jgi:hypothetical protein